MWRRLRTTRLFTHRVMTLERRELGRGEARREALVVTTPDWVNVVAVRDDRRVVLVRQWRYGVERTTLEIPGGMVDPGEDAAAAASRELEEETGYRAARLEHLGTLEPNPAIQSNRVWTYHATGLERVSEGPFGVGDEEIEIVTVPLAEIPARIAAGEIRHALVVAAFLLHALRSGGLDLK